MKGYFDKEYTKLKNIIVDFSKLRNLKDYSLIIDGFMGDNRESDVD